MNLEWVILAVTIFLVANVYYEGKLLNTLKGWKKYYQIGGVAIVGIGLYLFIKKNPQNGREVFASANQFIKYLPIDKNTTDMLTPIFDFTSKSMSSNLSSVDNMNMGNFSVGGNGMSVGGGNTPQERRMMNSGGNGNGNGQNGNGNGNGQNAKATKRSVSETKKKYVASQQGWTCGDCKCQLPAWFEIDHKVRLEYGGSNHIDNLVALCRNCHGKKTAFENL
jgi:hypothetical protein